MQKRLPKNRTKTALKPHPFLGDRYQVRLFLTLEFLLRRQRRELSLLLLLILLLILGLRHAVGEGIGLLYKIHQF